MGTPNEGSSSSLLEIRGKLDTSNKPVYDIAVSFLLGSRFDAEAIALMDINQVLEIGRAIAAAYSSISTIAKITGLDRPSIASRIARDTSLREKPAEDEVQTQVAAIRGDLRPRM